MAIWRTLPMGASALRACWGATWLRPATREEREAWMDSPAYELCREHFRKEGREFDPDGQTHAMMTLLDSTPANVQSYLREFEVVTEGPLVPDFTHW